MSDTMYDLIYSDDADREHLAAAFPDAVIEDASDGIHTERFSVTLPGARHDDYLLHVVGSDYALCSFTLGLMLRMEPDKARTLLQRAGRLPAATTERAQVKTSSRGEDTNG